MKTTRPIIPVPAPTLTTSRLLLRPFKQSDLADLHILRTQSDVMMWTSTGIPDADHDTTQAWMDRFLPPNNATTFYFAIEELNEPGKVVGVVGCHTCEPPEVGYMFRTEVWRKGYATEAMQCWLQTWWALPRKEVEIEPKSAASDNQAVREVLKADTVFPNHASKRILERHGFNLVSEEMVDDHQRNGEKIKLITLELQRPQ